MMKAIWKVCVVLAVAGCGSTTVNGQKEQVVDYVQSHGHNPNLSPEQIRHLMTDGNTRGASTTTTNRQGASRTRVVGGGTIGETAHITREHVLANVNKYGHDPSLTPEAIYERIRNEK